MALPFRAIFLLIKVEFQQEQGTVIHKIDNSCYSKKSNILVAFLNCVSSIDFRAIGKYSILRKFRNHFPQSCVTFAAANRSSSITMSWDDVFKSFFNIPRHPPGESDEWVYVNPHQNDEQDFYGDEGLPGQDPFEGFGNFGEGFTFRFAEPDQLFKHFEEMFRDFGMADFPSIGDRSGMESERIPHSSPRDNMLKDKSERSRSAPPVVEPREPRLPEVPSIFSRLWKSPHWDRIRPQDKIDQELDPNDERVLDDIVKGSKSEQDRVIVPYQEPKFHSSFQSVSIKTVRRPDGSVEHIKTVRGSDGKEETTITRSQGDQSHSVTTRKSGDGEEKTESFTNLDENELKRFNSLWSDGQAKKDGTISPRIEERDEETKSIFKNLFGFSLPGFGRT